MLTRALALSVVWLFISVVPTLLWGTHLHRRHPLLGLFWLLSVVLVGDLVAIVTFGQPVEIWGASALMMAVGSAWILALPNWNPLGQVTWAVGLMSTLAYLAYSFAVTAFSLLHPIGFLLSLVLFSVEVAALVLSLTFLYETLDVSTRVRWNHRFAPAKTIAGFAPKVSLHIPAYNEPPEIVEQTLRSLARMDYPDFEVILVDNNTPDEDVWRPLEAVCWELGPNFRCLHLDQWPGYKSGALNFALTQTSPEAEIIAVIDADYQVEPEYLRQTVPYLKDPKVAFLQTPQDYRDYHGSPFLEACYDAYKYFFEIPMASRNEHNAIIFGGTMGLIRKSVLQQIGGWDEWCITEDAEASLRMLKLGYKSVYINHTYGRGLMPANFQDLKRQRFRWCFGGIQILRKHWEALMPWAGWIDPANRLTLAQRYYYLVSGLQWFNELTTLIFTLLLLIGGTALALGEGIGVRPLSGLLAVVPLVFLGLGLWRFLWALRSRLGLGWRRAARAMGSFFSLSWTVTLASIQGLIQPRGVFLRTPKAKSNSSILRALQASRWEAGLGFACATIGLLLAARRPELAGWIVVIFLVWQAGFYLSAPAYSLSSESTRAGLSLASRGDIRGQFIVEGRAARWLFALFPALIIGYVSLRALPQPTGTPMYASLQPASLQQILIVPTLAIVPPTAIPFPTLRAAPTLPTLAATPIPPSAVPTARPLPSAVPTPMPRPTPRVTPPPVPTRPLPAPTHPPPPEPPAPRGTGHP